MSTGKVMLITVVTAALTSAATFFGLRALTSAPALAREVQVPELSGLRVEEARLMMDSRGLLLAVSDTIEDARIEAGRIIRQSPMAGSSVRAGGEVRVIISAGLPQVEVPSVIGLPLATATELLTGAGLRAGEVSRQEDEQAAAGQVLGSRPAPGQRVTRGSAVALTISSRPDLVAVPSLLGRSLSQATQLLTSAGFQLGRVTYGYDEDRRSGVVIRQTPPAASTAARGSTVNLVMNEGD